MANWCFNSLSIAGPSDILRNAHKRFSEAAMIGGADGWASVVYDMADEARLCHADEVDRYPFNTVMNYEANHDGQATLEMTYDTKWWLDPLFMTVLSAVFSSCSVELYAEEFSSEGAVRYSWRNGELVSSEESVENVHSSCDSDWNDAVLWDDGRWEVDYIETPPHEVFQLFVSSEDENIREYAASNPHTPVELLIGLLTDEESQVVEAAWENPAVTDDVVEAAVREKHSLPESFDLSGFPRESLATYLMDDTKKLSR
ncbi:hypothetical protein AB0O65_10750 [Microbacterium sp. NPDC077391]|uniref:hypothetical protein n=1 Tax=Microbacterium sp. NPDC077391 TaxID=3154765 RepID=UPI003430B4E0